MTTTKKINFVLALIVIVSAFALTCMYHVAPESAHAEGEIYYGAESGVASVSTETFSYSYYLVDSGYANPYCPQYYNTNSSLTNACGPVAGAIVVGYYDRYSTSLIPNFTPGSLSGGIYSYYPMVYFSSTIQGVTNSLFISMGTNTQQSGTSQAQYNSGLSSYVTSAGYTFSHSSVMSGGSINYSSLVSQLSNNRVLSVFMSGYNYCSKNIGSTSATYTINSFNGNHIYISYGYERYRYYDSNGNNFRTDLFLCVSTGLNSPTTGWYWVGSSTTTLNDVEVAVIT